MVKCKEIRARAKNGLQRTQRRNSIKLRCIYNMSFENWNRFLQDTLSEINREKKTPAATEETKTERTADKETAIKKSGYR